MSIFSRVSDIITANLNALLDRAADPEAMLAQLIREMEEGVAQARRHAAVAIAAGRGLQRERDENRVRAEHWNDRARAALAADRKELARRALARKLEHAAVARSLDEQHAEAERTEQSARTGLQALEARLAEARRKQRTLLARHQAAQVRVAVCRYFDGGRAGFGASLDRFDCLEDRLNRRADELAAEADLHDPAGLETEFTDLERERAIDRELEALKREP